MKYLQLIIPLLLIGCKNPSDSEIANHPLVGTWEMLYYDESYSDTSLINHLVIGQNSSIDYWKVFFNSNHTGGSMWIAGLLRDDWSFNWYVNESNDSICLFNDSLDTAFMSYKINEDTLYTKESYKSYCFIKSKQE
jgi:hypothetical protein